MVTGRNRISVDTDTVLFVDDEPEVLRALSRDMSRWIHSHGLRIATAESGRKCLDLLERQGGQIGIVVADLRMPDMKGSDLLAAVAAAYPGIGRILLTAYSDMEDISRAVEASIHSLIQKPWNPEALGAEIQRVFRVVNEWSASERKRWELEQHLSMAAAFQESFLSYNQPDPARMTVEISSQASPGLFVTGDYYDVRKIDEHRTLMLTGDVSGHGVRPALITGLLKHLTRQYVNNEIERGEDFLPGAFMRSINISLQANLPELSGMFISLIAVLIDLENGLAVFANAGHPYGIVLHGGKPIAPSSTGPALGFDRDAVYRDSPVDVEPGDRIVLFTDGLFDDRIRTKVGFDVESLGMILARADAIGGSFLDNLWRLLRADFILDTRKGASAKYRDDVTIASAKIHPIAGDVMN